MPDSKGRVFDVARAAALGQLRGFVPLLSQAP